MDSPLCRQGSGLLGRSRPILELHLALRMRICTPWLTWRRQLPCQSQDRVFVIRLHLLIPPVMAFPGGGMAAMPMAMTTSNA
jgi:hypothetical protein